MEYEESSSASSDGIYSSVGSSDLDEFIMSSAVPPKKKKRDGFMTIGKRKNVSASKLPSRLSPQVKDLLGKGSMCFVQRDYDLAIEYLEEAVRLAPGVADPFVTLGSVYEELGDTKRCIEALLVAAHLSPGDHLLWKRVALLSESIGQLDQTVYCLKRCLRSPAVSEIQKSEYILDLANILMQLSDFESAAKFFSKSFLESKSLECGTSLAKCLYNINEKPEAMNVLESLFDEGKFDANSVNMLAEVYLDIREFGKCFALLTSILDMENLSDPEKCPVDLVAKLAICAAPSFTRHQQVVTQAVACVTACPPATHSDLYMSVADGLISAGLIELALALSTVSDRDDPAPLAGLFARSGRCHYLLEHYEEAVFYFEKSQVTDPETVVMRADALRRIGRELEAGELMASAISYEELLACRTLPSATSTADRRKKLTQLEILLEKNDPLLVANLYLPLFGDCELDAQRIARHRTADVPSWRVRKELDLENVEDRLGSEKFVHLVVQCSLMCAQIGRSREAVDLIETILHNKRKKWQQRTEGFVDQLESLSFEISIKDPLLFKTSIKYLRQSITLHPETTLKSLATISRIIFKNSKMTQRELLDQRSWLVRTACKSSDDQQFGLCLLAGHFCMYSCNYSFAVQEYMRAHRMRPSDPWALLNLGSAMLSFAMSRTAGSLWLENAFSVFADYARQEPGEVEYNLGRACHQISQFTQADRHYRCVIKIGSTNRIPAAYNLALMRRKSGLDAAATRILLSNIIAK